MTAATYAAASRLIAHAIGNDLADVDETLAAYMLMRAAALHVGVKHGYEKAAELSYRLADEFSTLPKVAS